ncbi:MAG TPA: class I SAM-dependent methyltransferase [Candidatus Nanoarchaeia archaeon]|nr:class I SAM-dependent methyltransferase [Candidatus Nanoarchaeia archaeon]
MDLKELLSYHNPRMEEYQKIIAGTVSKLITCEGTNSLTLFMDNYKFFYGEETFSRGLTGRILIDLGCGWMHMAKYARDYGAKAYLGVDKFHPFPEPPAAKFQTCYQVEDNFVWETGMLGETEGFIVKGDMLELVARLPDQSASFVVNSVDATVIPSVRYHHALAEELERTTADGGIVFGMCSDVLKIMKQRRVLHRLEPERNDYSGLFVKENEVK